jgi:phosphonate transport system substrate-binding protein
MESSGRSPEDTLRKLASRLLCIAAAALCGAQAGAADGPYEFGVLPYLPPAKIQQLYEPIAADFEAKLGRPVWLSSMPDFSLFLGALSKEIYDIAFVQPFHYVEAHDKYGYLPLARRSEPLQAFIVVRPDSPLRTIKDLKGKIIANPPAGSMVAHLTSMALQEAGINPATGVTRDYGKNQFSCMQSVLIRAADACGTAEQALMHFEEEKQMKTRFRIVHTTPPSPSSVFVVHKRVAEKDRELLLNTILAWPTTAEGKKLLKAGQFIPFAPALDADYDSVRRYLRTTGNPSSPR